MSVNLIERVSRLISRLLGKETSSNVGPRDLSELSSSVLFDSVFYLKQAHQLGITECDVFPLRHYIEHGEQLGLQPHILFQQDYYKSQLLKAGLINSEASLLEHYLYEGYKRGLSPHPLFDPQFVQSQTKEIAVSSEPALVDYLRAGWKKGLKPHALFDSAFYFDKNPDVAAAQIEPLSHYVYTGEIENRQANKYFDVGYYRQYFGPFKYFDTALGDYAKSVVAGKRKPNRWFDSKFYSDKYPEAALYQFGLFAHYCLIGADQGFDAYPQGSAKSDPYRIENNSKPAEYPVAPGESDWNQLLEFESLSKDIVATVVVPVYKNYDLTLACIFSVLKAKVDCSYTLLVVNDCSPDAELAKELTRLEKLGHFRLLCNSENLGFVGTVNRAFKACDSGDVVLLNSDTIVYDGWLDRLLDASKSSQRIGTVTPFSNNATICSYPFFCQDNNQTLEVDYEILDKTFAITNSGKTAPLPTAVGFCMLITRGCLEQVGSFDEEAFGKGYGEENDFCLRATQLGWLNIIACDTFVRHLGSASFGTEKKQWQQHGQLVLNSRYPFYEGLIDDFCKDDNLKEYRKNVDLGRLMQPRYHRSVLLFGHREGGGTEKHIQDLARRLEQIDVRAIIAHPSESDPALLHFNCLDTGFLPNLALDLNSDWQASFEFLQAMKVSHIHIHQFAPYGKALQNFISQVLQNTQIPIDLTVHDYTAVCPRITFVDGKGLYCGEPLENVCQTCVDEDGSPYGRVNVHEWRLESAKLLNSMRRVFVPNEDVLLRFKTRFDLADKLLLRPHFEKTFETITPVKIRKDGEPFRIAVIGSLNPHKGHEVVLACAQDALARNLPIHFVIVGFSFDESVLSKLPNVSITGPYNDDGVHELIVENHCHASFFASIAPETFSYTFGIAAVANLYPFAFDLGAISARIKNLKWGHLMPIEFMSQPEKINDVFLSTELTTLSSYPETQYPDLMTDYYDFPKGYWGTSLSISKMS